jgi:hypothetical protein
MTPISRRQFALFRLALGVYLAIHLAALVPYGGELFGNRGLLANARLNFTFGILPNLLEHYDSPACVTCFLVALSILALAFAFGIFRRATAVLLWYGWACLFNRNNLINNPSIPYIGMLLLLTTLVPRGEGLAPRPIDRAWKFPTTIYWTAWILMAAGYSFSGWMKLHSPSWVDGSALYHVLNNPLARPGPVRDLLLALPTSCLRILTWASLAAELLFLPLSVTRHGRMIAWSALVAMNIGIVFAINFADLTIGMLLLHFFTFDSSWLAAPHFTPITKVAEPKRPILAAKIIRALEMLAFLPSGLDGAVIARLTLPSADNSSCAIQRSAEQSRPETRRPSLPRP